MTGPTKTPPSVPSAHELNLSLTRFGARTGGRVSHPVELQNTVAALPAFAVCREIVNGENVRTGAAGEALDQQNIATG